MAKYKLGIVSLGCDKNRVDTEIVLGKLNGKFEITNNPKEADIIIVNTCGFIESSKQESINTILEMAEYKKKYKCKVLVATGCLSQRYNKELQESMPELDIILGVNDYDKLAQCIEEFYQTNEKILLCSTEKVINEGERILTTGSNYAYVRISEGCNNNCTYCAIPKIRGPYRSREIQKILNEVKQLTSQGVKEIIIIAQDSTMYGADLYGEKKLSFLVDEISKISGVKWIRLLYCYPEEITEELIDTIANNAKVCKYIDMPIQHISDRVLKMMGRRGNKEKVTAIISKLKNNVRGISLRTTFIVGFPGETNDDFSELVTFVKDTGFDHMGVFRYSPEEGTAAANLKNEIDERVKKQRERELMLLQKEISSSKNKDKVGNVYEVLIEGFDGEFYVGRTQYMAPEIDGVMLVNPEDGINIGDFIKVKVTKTGEYDLVGDVYHESCE